MTYKTEKMISYFPLLRGESGVCQIASQSFFSVLFIKSTFIKQINNKIVKTTLE